MRIYTHADKHVREKFPAGCGEGQEREQDKEQSQAQAHAQVSFYGALCHASNVIYLIRATGFHETLLAWTRG